MKNKNEGLPVYCFDQDGRYAGSDHADPDPMNPGEFIMPMLCTPVKPPPVTQPGHGLFWDGEKWEVKHDEMKHKTEAFRMRFTRNRLLMQSDWTQISDVPISSYEKVRWARYRKTLRNLPEHPNWPFVKFPEPPEKEEQTA